MKKAVFMMGSIEFTIGAVLLWMQTIAKNALPMAGEILCQANGGGHFHQPLSMEFVGSAVPVLLMAVGILQIAYVFLGKRKSGEKPENPIGTWLRGEEKEG